MELIEGEFKVEAVKYDETVHKLLHRLCSSLFNMMKYCSNIPNFEVQVLIL